MPRGGARPGAGRPRKGEARPHRAGTTAGTTPLEYMLAVMRDETADAARRDRMAVAAAVYMHLKKGDGGKKDAAKAASEAAASGKFATAAPPKLAVVNGKPITT